MRKAILTPILCVAFVGFAFLSYALLSYATQIPNLSFEDLVSRSDQIVTGHVTRSWSSFGTGNKFIWTNYAIAVDEVLKGSSERTTVVSEPGGEFEGVSAEVPGSVSYKQGEHVTLFLHRLPSGIRRTVGWEQGKLDIDGAGRVHTALQGSETVSLARSALPRATAGLNGMDYPTLRARIRALTQRRLNP